MSKKKHSAGQEGPLKGQSQMLNFRLAKIWDRILNEHLLLIVFLLAVLIRLLYLRELSEAPFFHHPVGDSAIYHERAVAIAAGDLIGREAYFHSSPLYPYFLGVIYKLFGVHFTFTRLIQFLIGSGNCLLIYLIVRRLPEGNKATATLAGLFAAFYGVFVFFDGDLLMIPLVLFFTLLSIFLLLTVKGGNDPRSHPARATVYYFLAGSFLGFAGLGKPNVLLFAPFALIWIVTGFGKRINRRQIISGVIFACGCCLAVLPITLRNYVVSKDFVLVSSNAGVNLYIGNNKSATGVFFLPPESGLENTHLYLSSKTCAEKATGITDIKPSQVSCYWSSRAFDYMREHPGEALRLMWRKFLLFWNHFEIPNHHNFYYIRLHYGGILNKLVIGFSLIVPLALIGTIAAMRRRSLSSELKLCFAFVIVYMVSLIPFFITARYRLPVVPFLIIFAALGVRELAELIRAKQIRWISIYVVMGLAALWVTRLPLIDFDFGFTHTVMGTAYSDLATEDRANAPGHMTLAILEYKKALEIQPLSVDAQYNLGVAYQRIGYYSGAIPVLQAAVGLKPNHPYAKKALDECRASLQADGDRILPQAVPMTWFEQGLAQMNKGNQLAAKSFYEKVLEKDPHHANAYSQLGAIYFERGDFERAIKIFSKGLHRKPDHFVLNNNIAGAYYRRGDIAMAKRHWEKCLESKPGDESVLRQLRMVGE
jgi:tetratricopeptide (TPR) repeat protein